MNLRSRRSKLCWFYIRCAGMPAMPLYSDQQTVAEKPIHENALPVAADGLSDPIPGGNFERK